MGLRLQRFHENNDPVKDSLPVPAPCLSHGCSKPAVRIRTPSQVQYGAERVTQLVAFASLQRRHTAAVKKGLTSAATWRVHRFRARFTCGPRRCGDHDATHVNIPAVSLLLIFQIQPRGGRRRWDSHRTPQPKLRQAAGWGCAEGGEVVRLLFRG